MADKITVKEAKKPSTFCTDSPDEIVPVAVLAFVLIHFQKEEHL